MRMQDFFFYSVLGPIFKKKKKKSQIAANF